MVAFELRFLSTFSEFLSAVVYEKTADLVVFLYQNPRFLLKGRFKRQRSLVVSCFRWIFSSFLCTFPLHFLYDIGVIVNFIRIEEVFKKIREISLLQELKINGRGKSSVINTWILKCVHIMKCKRARDHIHNDAANFRVAPVGWRAPAWQSTRNHFVKLANNSRVGVSFLNSSQRLFPWSNCWDLETRRLVQLPIDISAHGLLGRIWTYYLVLGHLQTPVPVVF